VVLIQVSHARLQCIVCAQDEPSHPAHQLEHMPTLYIHISNKYDIVKYSHISTNSHVNVTCATLHLGAHPISLFQDIEHLGEYTTKSVMHVANVTLDLQPPSQLQAVTAF